MHIICLSESECIIVLVYSLNVLKQFGRKLEVLPNTQHPKERKPQV